MTFDLAQMIADREAGTPGPWVYEYTCIGHTVLQPGEMNRGFGANHAGKPEPDARRIARVPLYEAEIIRLTARVERLTTGLEFYADESKYEKRRNPITYCTQEAAEIGPEGDCGDTARAALSTHTEEPKT